MPKETKTTKPRAVKPKPVEAATPNIPEEETAAFRAADLPR